MINKKSKIQQRNSVPSVEAPAHKIGQSTIIMSAGFAANKSGKFYRSPLTCTLQQWNSWFQTNSQKLELVFESSIHLLLPWIHYANSTVKLTRLTIFKPCEISWWYETTTIFKCKYTLEFFGYNSNLILMPNCCTLTLHYARLPSS